MRPLAALCLVSAPLLVSALPNALQPAGPVARGTLPNLLIQYGEPRTASTLQFQTLCAIALVLNKADPSRVVCSFLPAGPTPPGDLAGKAADQTTLHVVKTHSVPAEGFPNNAWLFASEIDDAVGADDPWQGAAQRMSHELNHEVKYAQVMSRLAERGSGIASEYQSFFGLSDPQIEEVVTYLRYWDILRMCCGAQMDDGYRAELGGGAPADVRAGPGSYLMTVKPESCHRYDIQAIERHAVQTQVFQLAVTGGKGSAYLRSTSSLEADAGYELNGQYCKWFNKEVTCQKLDFNRLPESPGCSGEQPPTEYYSRPKKATTRTHLPVSSAEPESEEASHCGDWCAVVGGPLRQGDEQCGWDGCKGCKGCAEDEAGGNSVMRPLTPGVLSPLLSWTSHEAKPVKLELFGKTFSAERLDMEERLLKERAEGAQCQHGIKRPLNSAEQLAAGGAGSGSFACCPAACGQCGGGGCERKPGGSLQCCVYGLVASNQFCQNETSVACIVSAATSLSATGDRHKDSRQRQQEEAEFMSIAKKAEEAQRATQQVLQTEGAERKVDWAQASNLAANEAASTMAIALTFLAPGKEEAQWFGQLTLKANGVPVLNVSRGEGGFGEMVVEIDGKTMARGWKASDHSIDQSFNSKLGMRSTLKFSKKHVGGTHGQALVVEAPGFKFSIESRPASKFSEKADQIKYGHLNLKFDEDALPKLSKGFLAQLAGVREMTERRRSSYSVTNSLPARPSSTALADFESDELWVRRSLDDLF
jgi:hypothetical protein